MGQIFCPLRETHAEDKSPVFNQLKQKEDRCRCVGVSLLLRNSHTHIYNVCVCVCVRMCMCVWVSVKARHTACIHTYQMRNRSTWNVSHIGSFSRQSLLIAPLQHVTSLSASVFCQLVTHKSWYTEDINFTRWPIDLFVLFWLLPLFCHPIKVRNKTLLIL